MTHQTYTPEWGSSVARRGFENEGNMGEKFREYKTDTDAQRWLRRMGYNQFLIESITVNNLSNQEKPDLEVIVRTKNSHSVEYISVKRVTESANFNSAEKRWVEQYADEFEMDGLAREGLKMFVGREGSKPEQVSDRFDLDTTDIKDERRLYIDELPEAYRNAVLSFFDEKQQQIIRTILSGRNRPYAEWLLVTRVSDGTPVEWVLTEVEDAVEHFSGDVTLSSYGNIHLGGVTVQRKGGDNGRETAQMLQYKIKPLSLFGD